MRKSAKIAKVAFAVLAMASLALGHRVDEYERQRRRAKFLGADVWVDEHGAVWAEGNIS